MLSLGFQAMSGTSSHDGVVAALHVGDCDIKAMSSGRVLAIGTGMVAVQSKSMGSAIIHDGAIIGCDVEHSVGLLLCLVLWLLLLGGNCDDGICTVHCDDGYIGSMTLVAVRDLMHSSFSWVKWVQKFGYVFSASGYTLHMSQAVVNTLVSSLNMTNASSIMVMSASGSPSAVVTCWISCIFSQRVSIESSGVHTVVMLALLVSKAALVSCPYVLCKCASMVTTVT